MNLKKYIPVYKKHIHPYPVLLVSPSFNNFGEKHLNSHLSPLYILIDNGIWQAYLDEKNWIEQHKKMLKLHVEDNLIMNEFMEKFQKESKKFLEFTKRMMEKDYETMSDQELFELYKEYNKSYINSFQYGEPPAQNLKEGVERKIKQKLKDLLKDEIKINNIISLIIMPFEETFVTREERELLSIALKKSQGTDVAYDIENHCKKYAWITVDYNGEPAKDSYFIKRVKEMCKKDPEKALARIKEITAGVKEHQNKVIEEYNIDGELVEMCRAAKKCMVIMDMKKEVFSQAHYHVQFLMNAIAKRFDMTYTQVCYLTPKEIEKGFKLGKFDKEMLDKRYLKSAYWTENEEVTFLSKEEEEKIRKALQVNPTKNDELKGVCGNPGYTKGKARVIMRNEQFKEMIDGEILVTPYTTPEYIIVMKKASAIVTDMGGVTSHSSIVARELDIPCVVGTHHATKIIKTGDRIEVNATEGKVKII